MVVQHNMQAMNANRMLGITAGQQAKSTEKLSSGYKINRAADNAAGLAISEKMRKQIRGLDQASSNAQDGISAVQTAEGALNEVQDMLQRMNELAVQAANGTNSVSDRQSIQDEIDQLTTEIDRVSETTKFNETYLLKGDRDAEKRYSFSYKPVDATASTASATFQADPATTLEVEFSFIDEAAADDQNAIAKNLRDQGISVTEMIVAEYDDQGAVTGSVKKYNVTLNGDAAKNYSINLTSEDGTAFEIVDAGGTKIGEGTVSGGSLVDGEASNVGQSQTVVIAAQSVTSAAADPDVARFYDKDGNAISANALGDYFSYSVESGEVFARGGVQLYDAVGNAIDMENARQDVVANTNESTEKGTLMGDLKLKLHVGADATKNNQITINLKALSAKGLGVNGLKVNGADDKNALDAIETIKSALSTVSAQRSELGAAQNRLEHTIANLDNIVENTTSAESAIRDTDMAEEMVKYSKSNILAQAGQSMLAQANQSNQGVLSLLG